MVVLRLKKIGSYYGYGIKATVNDPLVQVDDETARKLIATGYFTLESPGFEAATEPKATPEEIQNEVADAAEDIPAPTPATKKKGGK
jgi:hypothetical protein